MYVLGEVSPEEAKQVEHYVRQYPEVAKELRAAQEAFIEFNGINGVAASKEMKQRIMNKIPGSVIQPPPVNGSTNVFNKGDRNGQPPFNFF